MGYAEILRARDVELYAEPHTIRIEPYGDTRMFSVRSPDGAILEFFETL